MNHLWPKCLYCIIFLYNIVVVKELIFCYLVSAVFFLLIFLFFFFFSFLLYNFFFIKKFIFFYIIYIFFFFLIFFFFFFFATKWKQNLSRIYLGNTTLLHALRIPYSTMQAYPTFYTLNVSN